MLINSEIEASQSVNEKAEAMVKLHNINKEYTKGSAAVKVLNDVNFTIKKGEFIALMGPSGSGKTTLLNIIGGIDRPSSGSVYVGGKNIIGLNSSELTAWRAQEVGFIFQFYHLIAVLNAEKNVELPLSLFNLSRDDIKKRVDACFKLVGLENRNKHFPNELSGGQQQRVAIARAIVTDPDILLCDEPTGDLDRESAEQVLDLLAMLNKNYGKTIVLVTHDPQAAAYAHKTVYLNKGVVEETRRNDSI